MLKYAAIAALLATPVAAQQNCAPYEIVDERLQSQYGEQVRTAGIGDNGQSVVLQYANEETGTWTIVVLNPVGMACLVASGEAWELREVESNDEPT